MRTFKGVGIGAGYFSPFQYEAWGRIPETAITALCNRNRERAAPIMIKYGIAHHYVDWQEMILKEKPDFVDIITPPETHLEMCKFAADQGIHIICQKPLAPTFEKAREIVDYVQNKNIRFMVHENWRFQPWYREIKKLLKKGVIGELHTMNFRKRMGDGWGENAYIPRQPYFRNYPRLIVYENGIHFIDTFRFLAGEILEVYAKLRKMNPVIAGEDWAMILFKFEDDVIGFWDANRYNEPNYPSPRYTFGEFLMEGYEGAIRLYGDGKLTIQPLGKQETEHIYQHKNINFSGDCVYATQRHFIDCLLSGEEFETNGPDYLKSLAGQEAAYRSAEMGMPVQV
ncbi:gfo/Idh/MocA family oxidoreductase [candidate division KSB1 bacterium]|nr:Gfo/Idh/MocA family oxidoreductase [candidate division KSB1 bacterium]RQW00710.1 MAG: gfo/Idh/MocA family oxidoreductase [candidate division KSB1 bacterium]